MTEQQYISLILRNLKGELSPAEFKELNSHTASNAERSAMRLQLEDMWDMAGDDVQKVTKEETAALLRRIKTAQTPSASKKSTTKVLTLRKVISAIAAVAITVLAATWLMQDRIITYDTAGVYTLSDGTEVTLREGSQLDIVDMSSAARDIELRGEAYFDVTHEPSRPFVVTTRSTTVQVLGTSFLVKEVSSETIVELHDGKVLSTNLHTQDTAILTTGMKAIHTAEGIIIDRNTKSNLTAWKRGYYNYDKVKLSDAVKELATIFNRKIVINSTAAGNCLISANLPADELEALLGKLASIHRLEVSKEGNTWVLNGNSCE